MKKQFITMLVFVFACRLGISSDSRIWDSQGGVSSVPEMSCKEVYNKKEHLKIIDVRTPEEWTGELGHIPGAIRITLGSQLTDYLKTGNKNEDIVFVCRSGKRSAQATAESINYGYAYTRSMTGGMIQWNQEGLPVER